MYIAGSRPPSTLADRKHVNAQRLSILFGPAHA
jgi:hypothetical protein